MRMYDLIEKKRNGGHLTLEEISFMIRGYVAGEIPDYQMAAMLMAIYFQGMTDTETFALTDTIVHSGDVVSLADIEGIKVDKHSTGGVGDKTTLIAAPIAAACGVKVAKMSGRGLGHTGGTVDKLEAIPGFMTDLDRDAFIRVVNEAGLSIIGQSGNLTPADKKLYALRDVTATVDSIPLIASSVMSKKIAAGNDCILLDVKVGSGAFMKNLDDAVLLAKKMVEIGERAGRRTIALITNMDVPLGNKIGNALEIEEAVEVLNGAGPEDLREVSVQIAANMLYLADKGSIGECLELAEDALNSRRALVRLYGMVKAQGGDASCIEDPGKLPQARYSMKVKAQYSGYISSIDTEGCGIASVMLGAGRQQVGDEVDHSAGIVLRAKVGQYVEQGDTVAELYSSKGELLASAHARLGECFRFSRQTPHAEKLIFARVEEGNVEYL